MKPSIKYTYLLRHGFGFMHDYWRNLVPLLDGEVVFFGKDFRYDPNCHYVGVGHSIGFQKLNNSGIPFDFLIGLQGFLDFCGHDAAERNVRERNIDGMIKIFKINNILQALKTFYNACQYPGPLPQNVNPEELTEDLQAMKKSYEHCGIPTLMIGSNSDKIVPMNIINDNFQSMKNVTIETINDIPHSLGFIKMDEVVTHIKRFILSQHH